MRLYQNLSAFMIILGPSFSIASVTPSWVVEHLGNLSPYKKAPLQSGIQETLPSDCNVNQVFYIGRHGSRYPLASELVFIQGLSSKLAKASASIHSAHLPSELEFLKSGYNTTLGHDDLTPPGRLQLFEHGVNFKLKYPQLLIDELLVGGQDRVEESAQWFREGYFGRKWANTSTFTIIPEDSKTISFITPSFTCPKWQYAYGNNLTVEWGTHYLPPITKRLNKLVSGVNLTDADTHGALYACAYDTAAYGIEKSPWCGVFSQSELLDFEYELDLLMVGAFGYGLPDGMGALLGSTIVNKIIQTFTKSSSSLVSFGHDTTIDFALTALGLAKDTPPLSPNVSSPKSNRKWRTTNQVPFGAQMIFEKFTCTSSAKGPQIRLILNDSPLLMSSCAKTSLDKKLGACSLDAFVSANAASTGINWGDSKWNTTCGNPEI
ncbi:histidine phosphatase family containing protein [Rhizoctonia solani]|uniref:Histidine phosphatase family containing protein n=1 Tax=Rhizoctonia solani TaxID=456999 RepID=A0A8H8NPK6_9AGAM|nr:histidine phosphatase family containing protein [Rhizoctonia solani]QRW17095.1 histidine phosphatase family containing protein [Rhizoctonia solani]